MCTLLYRPLDGGRYVAALGLNRDEVYARPSAPPRWWPPASSGASFVAPVDLVAGGTWFGLSETGLFVAITNGRQEGPFRHERSRGELVGDSLRARDLNAAVATLTARDAFAYAPCHLLLAQHDRVVYVAPDRAGRFAVTPLAYTPHTLTNAGLDLGDTPPHVPERDRDRASEDDGNSAADRAPEAVLASLRSILTTHDGPHARCRHGGDRGTRSSALLLLGPDLASSRLSYADGPPCVTAYAEVDILPS
jgi:hypothetical protein